MQQDAFSLETSSGDAMPRRKHSSVRLAAYLGKKKQIGRGEQQIASFHLPASATEVGSGEEHRSLPPAPMACGELPVEKIQIMRRSLKKNNPTKTQSKSKNVYGDETFNESYYFGAHSK